MDQPIPLPEPNKKVRSETMMMDHLISQPTYHPIYGVTLDFSCFNFAVFPALLGRKIMC
jgi:hypothetical protein